MPPLIDLTGSTCGRLTVLSRVADRVSPAGNAAVRWLARCDCGKTTVASSADLRSGNTRSCGCMSRKHLVGYRSAHRRVTRVRGLASDQACSACGKSAEQWAYTHRDPDEVTSERPDQRGVLRTVAYSLSPAFYVPLCRSCHTVFDQKGAAA